jgi:Family of unknown function (DUF6069)
MDDERILVGGRMTYYDDRPTGPAGPSARPGQSVTGRVDAGRLWAGGAATALVAALIALVGVLIVRALFDVELYAPSEAGALGDNSTLLLCLIAAVCALAATGLAHLLLMAAPRPLSYFRWIVGLVTVAAAVVPFISDGFTGVAVAKSLIYLVIGLAIAGLVSGAAVSASRNNRIR